MATVFLSFGGNIGYVKSNLRKAIARLALQIGDLKQASHFYSTAAWGMPEGTPRFVNVVAEFETRLLPDLVLAAALQIENSFGRKRTGAVYNNRKVDIDVLIFDDLIIATKSLTVPHPKMHQRNFILVPFCEIAPHHVHPILEKKMHDLLATCPDKLPVKKQDAV